MTQVLLTSLVTCKSIGAPWGGAGGTVPPPLTSISLESRQQLHFYSPSLPLSISLSLPFAPHFKVETRLEKKNKKTQRPNNWFPVSIPPPPPSFRNPTRSQWLSLPLSSPSIFLPPEPPRHPARPPPFLFCGFFPPFSFFRSVLLALNWNSALWNGKVIYIDSSGLFGCQSYPEPLVMLLETWQQ